MKKKILVIEDNLEVRENLEEILELYGYDVVSAENGKIGVQRAMEYIPDIILCDIMMPELDGFGVLNILSKKNTTSGIPFIFLTARSDKSDWRRGMNLGADDYITKPFYKDELLDVIELRLKKSDALRKATENPGDKWNAFVNEAKGYEALNKLWEDKRVKVFHKKALLYEEGDFPRHLFYIHSGKVKVFKTNEFGKELIINVFNKGDFIGYLDLIRDASYAEAAAALEDTEVSLIPKEDFLKLLYVNQDVSAQFIKMLVNNISEKEEQLLDLAYDSVRKRVASTLLKVYENYTKDGEKEIQILRDDLARMVGTAKESVIRMLTEFKDDGYIQIKEGKISIIDKDALEKIPG